MKVATSNKCDSCASENDFIAHFFFECPIVNSFWKNTEMDILLKTRHAIKLTAKDVLFGLYNDYLKPNEAAYINYIILIGKMCISIAKKTKALSRLRVIFDQQLSIRRLGLVWFGFLSL